MSVIDGGSFKCYAHEELYETTNPQDWIQHISDGSHTESGSGPCGLCGTITEFSKKPIGKKALCSNCKKEFAK